MTRGVDFLDVAAVLNFDLPGSARAYTHRVGRAARGGAPGVAVGFVTERERDAAKVLAIEERIGAAWPGGRGEADGSRD